VLGGTIALRWTWSGGHEGPLCRPFSIGMVPLALMGFLPNSRDHAWPPAAWVWDSSLMAMGRLKLGPCPDLGHLFSCIVMSLFFQTPSIKGLSSSAQKLTFPISTTCSAFHFLLHSSFRIQFLSRVFGQN
jgi:hypothetical protein